MTCAELAAACDWSQTGLGSRSLWAPTVERVVSMLLEVPAPMCYCHGAELSMVYNDAFAALLGQHHPGSWASPRAEVMPEGWARVRSCSPVCDAGGSILGVLVVAVETEQVLPQVPGLTMAARHHPMATGAAAGGAAGAATGAAAGGDFYDAFCLPDGRLVMALGEVLGRGVAAAAVLGRVRAALRAAALANPDPAAVLGALDDLVSRLDQTWPAAAAFGEGSANGGTAGAGGELFRGELFGTALLGGELFGTALLGILDPRTGEAIFTSAGHPPPAIARDVPDGEGGTRREAVLAPLTPGPPLGMPGERPLLRARLAEGDAVVAFTDGLLGHRGGSLTSGLSLLAAALATASREPRSTRQHLVDELVEQRILEDGCALFVVVRNSELRHTSTVMVPPYPAAVGGARRWVRHQLEQWELQGQVADDSVLGVSELVTNVLLHAGTPARVVLECGGDRLLVTVEDTGSRGSPHRPVVSDRPDGPEHVASRGRGLALVAAIADSCGYERTVTGSTVWFELRL